jgi:hypothetical protein
MEILSCFSNERICKALSLKEILVIVPLIKKMVFSSLSQVTDVEVLITIFDNIDALIALFEKDDESQNDFLEKFTMAFICANNFLNQMRLGKI